MLKKIKFKFENKEIREILNSEPCLLFLNQGVARGDLDMLRSVLGRLGVGVKQIPRRF